MQAGMCDNPRPLNTLNILFCRYSFLEIYSFILQALPTGEGIMMATHCSAEAVTAVIGELGVQDQVSIASMNGPQSVVVAGVEAEVETVLGELGQEGQRLRVLHAFHSPLMMPIAEEFRAVVESLLQDGALSKANPSIPVVSTVTGSLASPEELSDPEHWVRQVWSPVLFSAALEVALDHWSGEASKPCMVLEVGPNPVLSRMARPHVESGRVGAWCASLDMQSKVDELGVVMKAAGTFDEHLNPLPTSSGSLDLVFPNRKAFPWQTPPHPLLQHMQVIEDDGLIRHKAVFHETLMDLLTDHTIQGRCLFPAAGFVEMALAAEAARSGKNESSTYKGVLTLQDVAFLEPLDLEVGSALVCEVPANGRDVEFRPAGEPDHVVCSVGQVSHMIKDPTSPSRSLSSLPGTRVQMCRGGPWYLRTVC